MGETRRENLEQHVNSQMERCTRDLLRRFGTGGETMVTVKEETMVEDVELSLDLSLGGRFGVDRSKKNIVSASSVAAISFFTKKEEEEKGKEAVVPTHFLVGGCPLSVETKEDQRKKMQTLRRRESRRKRGEKKGLRPMPDDERPRRGEVRHMEGGLDLPRATTTTEPLHSLMNGVVCPPSLLSRKRRREQHNHARGSPSIPGWRRPSQTLSSVGVLGGGCTTSSSECGVMQAGLGGSNNPEANNTQSISSLTKQAICEALKKASRKANARREVVRSMVEEMPGVYARGAGPDGKRIEGFLCKYDREDDVRIICNCHGRFQSPAEFLKHAGAGDVDFPLKHIFVYPPPQCDPHLPLAGL